MKDAIDYLLHSRESVGGGLQVGGSHLWPLLWTHLRVTVEATSAPSDPGSIDLTVHGDAHRLKQVLMNLCLNARDAMPNGGRLTLRTERTEAGVAGRAWVRLSVQDTGEGMTEDVRARLTAV